MLRYAQDNKLTFRRCLEEFMRAAHKAIVGWARPTTAWVPLPEIEAKLKIAATNI
jgi:hypothetical protein